MKMYNLYFQNLVKASTSRIILRTQLVALCTCFCLTFGMGQTAKQKQEGLARSSKLFQALEKRDSLLFELAFNQQNAKGTDSLLHEDFEFYHDQGGLTDSKEKFLGKFKSTSGAKYKPLRKLQKNTLQLFPLYDRGKLYGLIQKGIHEFYMVDSAQKAHLTGSAKFTHLWIKQEDRWCLKRVLSYDHQEAKKD
ncbi:hypothetical protein BKI52_34935 [marine bacterium AO1-C]|nr:hypothetical protein BKI52_34935 [marine bacterium AO1-C]